MPTVAGFNTALRWPEVTRAGNTQPIQELTFFAFLKLINFVST
ncbi:MAG: hypothetical protein OJF59_001404 [Cytophagales bacterium]|jgi:hypothetical protein|nr:MAG: hypothetical protein OJF59_001404 [Cytophagales bacterium]